MSGVVLERAKVQGMSLDDRATGLNKLYLFPKVTVSDDHSYLKLDFHIPGLKDYHFSVRAYKVTSDIFEFEQAEEEQPGLFDIEEYTDTTELIKSAFLKDAGARSVKREFLDRIVIGPNLKNKLVEIGFLERFEVEFLVDGEESEAFELHVEDGAVRSVTFLSEIEGTVTGIADFVVYVSEVKALPGFEAYKFEVILEETERCLDIYINEHNNLVFTRFRKR